MNKTKKALIKRFKITKNGKIMRRISGQNHYRSKKTGEKKRKGRKWVALSKTEAQHLKKYLSK
jgi:large subunit ribosomal protein L35